MNSQARLVWSMVAVVAIWQLPYGRQILHPLSLLASYAHEMGHGVTALLLGEHFQALLLHADGSGLAVWRGTPSQAAIALIATGGLLGPTAAGVGLLVLSRSTRHARGLLVAIAALLTLSMILWSGNVFGTAFLLISATVLVLCARVLTDGMASFLLHLIAATLCLSWFSDLNYMFSRHALVQGVVSPSDSAVIASALGLPYWFWGGMVASASLILTLLGMGWVSRRSKR